MTCPKCQHQWTNITLHPRKCPNGRCQKYFDWSKDGQHPRQDSTLATK